MSGLSSICDYGSTDSEDSESELKQTTRFKLPLPSLSDLRTVREDRHEDDPHQHNGRFRRFPHVRGNWATFLYVQYPQDDSLHKLINEIELVCASVGTIEKIEDFHVSLSKTVVLKYHMILTFNASLKSALEFSSSFYLELDGIKVYCNDDKSRTFIALKVDHLSSHCLQQIVKQIDGVLNDFHLPQFYEDPSFHLSILWTHGDKVQVFETALKLFSTLKTEKPVFVDRVNCKIGNKYFQYMLD